MGCTPPPSWPVRENKEVSEADISVPSFRDAFSDALMSASSSVIAATQGEGLV